jgi:hypothetical protein
MVSKGVEFNFIHLVHSTRDNKMIQLRNSWKMQFGHNVVIGAKFKR